MRLIVYSFLLALLLPFACRADNVWQEMDELCVVVPPSPVLDPFVYEWDFAPTNLVKLDSGSTCLYSNAIYYTDGFKNSWPTLDQKVQKFDGTVWSFATDRPSKKTGSSFFVFNGLMYAAGGDYAQYPSSSIRDTVDSFNGTSWTTVNNLPAPRTAGSAATNSGFGWYFGGYYSGSDRADTYRFDGTNWTSGYASVPVATRNMTPCVHNGYIWLIAGHRASPVKSVFRFNGTSFTTMNDFPLAGYSFSAFDLNGEMYVCGGWFGYLTNAVWKYYDSNDTWSNVPPFSPANYNIGAGISSAVLDGQMYVMNTFTNKASRYPRRR